MEKTMSFLNCADSKFQILPIDLKLISLFRNVGDAPYRVPCQQIIILTNGKAYYSIDGENLRIVAPAVLLIARNKTHLFVPDNSSKGWIVTFTDEFLKTESTSLFSQFFQLSTIPIKRNSFFDKITSITELMHSCSINRTTSNLLLVRHLLSAFLIALEERKKRSLIDEPFKKTKNYETFNSFLDELEMNYKLKQTVGFYASAVSVSTRKLGEICKEILGKTTSQIIEERKIIEAKRLLLYTELSAQQIAYELGFEDHSYFTKVFKRHTKKTPLRYRQKHIGS